MEQHAVVTLHFLFELWVDRCDDNGAEGDIDADDDHDGGHDLDDAVDGFLCDGQNTGYNKDRDEVQ